MFVIASRTQNIDFETLDLVWIFFFDLDWSCFRYSLPAFTLSGISTQAFLSSVECIPNGVRLPYGGSQIYADWLLIGRTRPDVDIPKRFVHNTNWKMYIYENHTLEHREKSHSDWSPKTKRKHTSCVPKRTVTMC